MRCLIPDYQLIRNGLAHGGQFTIVISARRPVTAMTAPEVVSAPFGVRWPLERPVLRWAPPTRFSPPAAIDGFQPPHEVMPSPAPRKERIPRGEPPPVPD